MYGNAGVHFCIVVWNRNDWISHGPNLDLLFNIRLWFWRARNHDVTVEPRRLRGINLQKNEVNTGYLLGHKVEFPAFDNFVMFFSNVVFGLFWLNFLFRKCCLLIGTK